MVRVAQELERLLNARIKELDILVERKRRERNELIRTLHAMKPSGNGKLRRGMPEAAKLKIAAAQRARWAKFRKAAKNKGGQGGGRRKMAIGLVHAA